MVGSVKHAHTRASFKVLAACIMCMAGLQAMPYASVKAQNNYCGTDYADALACSEGCPNGLDGECNGTKCFAVQVDMCEQSAAPQQSASSDSSAADLQPSAGVSVPRSAPTSAQGPAAAASPSPTTPESGNYCGNDYADAIECMTACPRGLDGECASGRCLKVEECSTSSAGPTPSGPPSATATLENTSDSSSGSSLPNGCGAKSLRAALMCVAWSAYAMLINM
eukprot:jgi/Ulvmu1/1951/UM012_0112.1